MTDSFEIVGRAESIIGDAFSEFGMGAAVLTSFQREGVVVIDIARRIEPNCRVLTLDTGFLPAATQQMIRTVENHFQLRVERIVPDTAEVDAMVGLHGSQLFRESVPNRLLCCEVRKVRPLARYTRHLGAIFVGLRRAQTESRKDVPFADRSQNPVKISPLAEWTAEDVLRYTRQEALPEHPLYSGGYTSIGCDPCTRPIVPGETERAGRWWWETDIDKECGLHFTPDGKVVRTVDILLEQLLERSHAT